MESVGDWFIKEVFTWRRLASLIWTCILLPPVFWLFTTIASVSITQPYVWITGFLWFPFSPTIWLYSFLIMIVQVGLTLHKTSFYTVVPPINPTIISTLWSVLSPPHLLHMFTHGMGGGFISWVFVSAVGGQYSSLTKLCNDDSQRICLNEHHLFVVLSGVILGALYSFNYFLTGRQYVAFPVIQQAKFFVVKSSVVSVLAVSIRSVLRHLRGFYIFYFIFGSSIQYWFLNSLNVQHSGGVLLSSIVGLLDLSLFWQCLVSGTLIHFTWTINSVLFAAYMTEAYQFPVESPIEEPQHCLHQALTCSTHKIVQYLGFLDLNQLSQYSAKRRQQLFSLSQPGGHPHNWNKVVTQCLNSLETLTNDVVTVNRNCKPPVRQISGDQGSVIPTPRRKLHPSRDESQLYSSFNQESFTSPLYSDASLHHRSLQKTVNGSLNVTSPTNGHVTKLNQQSTVAVKPSFTEQLKKMPLFAYFVDDLPDSTSRKLFADCQKQIWALEALSHLVVASYTEDTYGVVQKSLADIITAIFSLQEAVEKHFKLSPNISRKSTLDGGLDASIRFQLKTTIKSSMYRIVTTFDQHMRKIPLSTEHSRLLELYLDSKE